MSEDIMKLRGITVSYDFDIGEDYTLEFTVFRRFEESETRTDIEVSLDCVEDELSFDKMALMSQIIGEESLRLGKINPDRYDVSKRLLWKKE